MSSILARCAARRWYQPKQAHIRWHSTETGAKSIRSCRNRIVPRYLSIPKRTYRHDLLFVRFRGKADARGRSTTDPDGRTEAVTRSFGEYAFFWKILVTRVK